MNKIALTRIINEKTGELELISVRIEKENQTSFFSKNLDQLSSANLSPFTVKDVKSMMLKPDLIITATGGTYRLLSDFSDNSDGPMANYLTYEKVSNPTIHKTRDYNSA